MEEYKGKGLKIVGETVKRGTYPPIMTETDSDEEEDSGSDKGFDRRTTAPTAGRAPDGCEIVDCTEPATHYVKFSNPTDYVCYCEDHAHSAMRGPNSGTRMKEL